jgi:hypothetical protein
MAHLNKLVFTQLKRGARISPTDQRRNKLVAKLEEQMGLARARIDGKPFVVTKASWTRDNDGNKTRIQSEKTVRPWWWQEADAITMVVRYGARPLELNKGKKAISVASIMALPDAIATIIAAVKAGELDAAMEAAVTSIRSSKGRE